VASGCLVVRLFAPQNRMYSFLTSEIDIRLSPYTRPRDQVHLEVEMEYDESDVFLESVRYRS
jgi:hypothetical protein